MFKLTELLVLFLLGLCVGSFLNCLVYRLNELSVLQGSRSLPRQLRGVLGGRSLCPKCKHQLAWYDNIPLLSFALLAGRCRYCQKLISIQYPLVELATGILTISIFFQLRGERLSSFESGHLAGVLFYLFITYALVAIFLSDLLYQTVPDEIVYPAIGLTILFRLFRPTIRGVYSGHLGGRTAFYLAGGMAAAFFLALILLTKGRGMGMGDVKLAGLMGLFLGFPEIVVALYLAFLTGAIVGVTLVLLNKKSLNAHIPFGPFLSTATMISLFWGEMIWKKIVDLLLLSF